MRIPYDDNLKVEYLNSVFNRDRISTCYKYFWLLAILSKITPQKTTFTYDELITEMVADAWYMVSEYHLRLGPNKTTDNLEEAVKYLYTELNKGSKSSTEKREKLIEYLTELKDPKYLEYKKKLINNVPYCLQSPFYRFTGKSIKLSSAAIGKINEQSQLIYYFSAFKNLQTQITISDEWVGYLCKNRYILQDWTRYNLIGYLQDRNPSVPGIADKILPPEKRNLERAKAYWHTVIMADKSLEDIYGHNTLSEIKISIDHFVPWQYVAHDELWNLHPTTKNINSSKSNSLPDWDTYFGALCDIEYKANELRYTNNKVADAFNKCAEYHVNNSEIRRALYSDRLARAEFYSRLDKVLRPVYESAVNCGFREWVYTNGK
ncbi:HNH endonuclease [Lachnospiraceae bacterium YSD2013]|nr:HNH endonuclease [Lachnospiraceae bacterium YSD2013]